jgi:hypothetical protein
LFFLYYNHRSRFKYLSGVEGVGGAEGGRVERRDVEGIRELAFG